MVHRFAGLALLLVLMQKCAEASTASPAAGGMYIYPYTIFRPDDTYNKLINVSEKHEADELHNILGSCDEELTNALNITLNMLDGEPNKNKTYKNNWQKTTNGIGAARV